MFCACLPPSPVSSMSPPPGRRRISGPGIYSNVIDFLPRRFRLVAAGGTVQSFCLTGGHLGNVG